MNQHKPRLVGDLMLGTRQTAAVLTGRHPDQVSRYCIPIACDVRTRLPLYDLSVAHETLRTVQRRIRRVA